MMPKFYYSDTYEVPLEPGHRFPMTKYRRLREELLKRNILKEELLIQATPIDKEFLYLAHTKDYVDSLLSLTLPSQEARAIGLPLNQEMVNRARASADGVFQASCHALEVGFSGALAGGTHHAHADRGEGFCFFNDFAIVCRYLAIHRPQLKVLILDLDVHQGNGNASILKEDENVFIVSLHGRKNYPFRKVNSHLDVEFEAGTEDDEYLDKLSRVLKKLSTQAFDLILYQAGVDILKDDRLGSLNISLEGVALRDQLVFNYAQTQSIPIAMAVGGGYSHPINKTVEAYVQTYQVAKKIYRF